MSIIAGFFFVCLVLGIIWALVELVFGLGTIAFILLLCIGIGIIFFSWIGEKE